MPKPPAYTITPVPEKRYAENGHYLRQGFVFTYPYPYRHATTRRTRIYVTRLHKLRGKTITVFKKALTNFGQCIVVLQVDGRVRRYSPRDGKCRASCAKVLAIHPLVIRSVTPYIQTADTTTCLKKAYSSFNRQFIYRVGETVRPESSFTPDPSDECASGIHFFLTLEEAVAYHL